MLRRGKVDVPALYEPPDRSIYGDVNWPAIIALVVGLAAGWSWEYGLVEPLQGPVAKALGNTDFSWAAGMFVAGGLYWLLASKRVRQTTPDSAAAAVTVIEVPAREGRGVRVAAGQRFRVIDVEGGQVADTFAFRADDVSEYHSAEHTRVHVSRLFPRVGEAFVTNRRRPILVLEEDRTPGIHDMLCAACDPERYTGLGVEGWHASCRENLERAMADLGDPRIEIPQPINLFMNIPVGEDGIARLGDGADRTGRLRHAAGGDGLPRGRLRLSAGHRRDQRRGPDTGRDRAPRRLTPRLPARLHLVERLLLGAVEIPREPASTDLVVELRTSAPRAGAQDRDDRLLGGLAGDAVGEEVKLAALAGVGLAGPVRLRRRA